MWRMFLCRVELYDCPCSVDNRVKVVALWNVCVGHKHWDGPCF